MNINSSADSLGFINRMMGLSAAKQANQMAKLSSGFRINSGKDSPADLIISELLRSQTLGTERAWRNTMETSNALSIADGALGSAGDMLTRMKSLVLHAANSGVTSGAQTSADQSEIDSLLQSIQRTVSGANYAGRNLLDGTSSVNTQMLNNNDKLLESFTFDRLSGSAGGAVVDFAGGAANQAELAYVDGQSTAVTADGTLAADQEIIVTGRTGSRGYSFAAGADLAGVAERINIDSEATGVQAQVVTDDTGAATGLRLTSSEYGSRQYVQVEQVRGNLFASAGDTVRDQGQDARVTVNGRAVTADGLSVRYDDGQTRGSFRLNADVAAQGGYDGAAPANAAAEAEAAVSGTQGGLGLQLGGGSGARDRETLSLPSYGLSSLGRVTVDGRVYSMNDLFSGGSASLASNPDIALRVVEQAIGDVAMGRGGIGAYQANTLQANMNNLSVEMENLSATESAISGTDMAQAITDMIQERLRGDVGLRLFQSQRMNAQNTARLLLGQG